jgi:segregation and condensation protein B
VEAVLQVSDAALTARKLVQLATLADVTEAKALIDRLNIAYDRSGSPFRIERIAAGYQLLTRPEYARWLDKLHHRQSELKLTPPAMETLTILAYRQPMTRADLEAIRGVQCTDILKMLMDRGLVRIAGEDDTLGRPYLYETTRKFLELFGLQSLNELPQAGDLRQRSESDGVEEAEAA